MLALYFFFSLLNLGLSVESYGSGKKGRIQSLKSSSKSKSPTEEFDIEHPKFYYTFAENNETKFEPIRSTKIETENLTIAKECDEMIKMVRNMVIGFNNADADYYCVLKNPNMRKLDDFSDCKGISYLSVLRDKKPWITVHTIDRDTLAQNHNYTWYSAEQQMSSVFWMNYDKDNVCYTTNLGPVGRVGERLDALGKAPRTISRCHMTPSSHKEDKLSTYNLDINAYAGDHQIDRVFGLVEEFFSVHSKKIFKNPKIKSPKVYVITIIVGYQIVRNCENFKDSRKVKSFVSKTHHYTLVKSNKEKMYGFGYSIDRTFRDIGNEVGETERFVVPIRGNVIETYEMGSKGSKGTHTFYYNFAEKLCNSYKDAGIHTKETPALQKIMESPRDTTELFSKTQLQSAIVCAVREKLDTSSYDCEDRNSCVKALSNLKKLTVPIGKPDSLNSSSYQSEEIYTLLDLHDTSIINFYPSNVENVLKKLLFEDLGEPSADLEEFRRQTFIQFLLHVSPGMWSLPKLESNFKCNNFDEFAFQLKDSDEFKKLVQPKSGKFTQEDLVEKITKF